LLTNFHHTSLASLNDECLTAWFETIHFTWSLYDHYLADGYVKFHNFCDSFVSQHYKVVYVQTSCEMDSFKFRYFAPPLIGGGIKRWCCLASDVCLSVWCLSVWRLSVAYIVPKWEA